MGTEDNPVAILAEDLKANLPSWNGLTSEIAGFLDTDMQYTADSDLAEFLGLSALSDLWTPTPRPTNVPVPAPTAKPTNVPVPAPTAVPIPRPIPKPTVDLCPWEMFDKCKQLMGEGNCA